MNKMLMKAALVRNGKIPISPCRRRSLNQGTLFWLNLLKERHSGLCWDYKTDKDEDGDYELQFLHRSTRQKMSYALVEPIQKEINFVEAVHILGVLPKLVPQSTKRQQGIIKFNVNFEEFHME